MIARLLQLLGRVLWPSFKTLPAEPPLSMVKVTPGFSYDKTLVPTLRQHNIELKILFNEIHTAMQKNEFDTVLSKLKEFRRLFYKQSFLEAGRFNTYVANKYKDVDYLSAAEKSIRKDAGSHNRIVFRFVERYHRVEEYVFLDNQSFRDDFRDAYLALSNRTKIQEEDVYRLYEEPVLQ